MSAFVGPAGAQRASGSTYSSRVGLKKFEKLLCFARAHGWNGTWPSDGSLTRLGARSLFAFTVPIAAAPPPPASASSPGIPPWGSVKLSWFAIVLDQWPWMSGCPSGSRGPAHSPGAIVTTFVSQRLERLRAP